MIETDGEHPITPEAVFTPEYWQPIQNFATDRTTAADRALRQTTRERDRHHFAEHTDSFMRYLGGTSAFHLPQDTRFQPNQRGGKQPWFTEPGTLLVFDIETLTTLPAAELHAAEPHPFTPRFTLDASPCDLLNAQIQLEKDKLTADLESGIAQREMLISDLQAKPWFKNEEVNTCYLRVVCVGVMQPGRRRTCSLYALTQESNETPLCLSMRSPAVSQLGITNTVGRTAELAEVKDEGYFRQRIRSIEVIDTVPAHPNQRKKRRRLLPELNLGKLSLGHVTT